MVKSLKRGALVAASALQIALVSIMWAVPLDGAAHLYEREAVVETGGPRQQRSPQSINKAAQREKGTTAARPVLPRAARLRQSGGRGLLVSVWVNGVGDYSFAVDTGAGGTIVSERVARAARVEFRAGRATIMSGISGAGSVHGQEARLRSLAIGDANNLLPSQSTVVVTDRLPPDVDGVLDPTEGFWPLGYSIDMRRGEISAFDPRANPLRIGEAPPGGAIVQWITERGSRRPFVMLDGGRRALLDTGSEFGLAVSESAARSVGITDQVGRDREGVRDIAGGRISARRVAPTTVSIGSLVLRGVPTDVLSGIVDGAPILLGRDALQPFYLSFDPLNRLILITP